MSVLPVGPLRADRGSKGGSVSLRDKHSLSKGLPAKADGPSAPPPGGVMLEMVTPRFV